MGLRLRGEVPSALSLKAKLISHTSTCAGVREIPSCAEGVLFSSTQNGSTRPPGKEREIVRTVPGDIVIMPESGRLEAFINSVKGKFCVRSIWVSGGGSSALSGRDPNRKLLDFINRSDEATE